MTQATFFFGAGISRASGKPLAPEITKSALTGHWHLHTDQNFYPGLPTNPAFTDSVTPTVQKFLTALSEIARDYIKELSRTPTPRQPHYEDLFSLSYQAAHSEIDHTPNLAVVEFLRRFRTETNSLHTDFTKGTQGGIGFSGLAETACDFLHWVVHHGLVSGSEKRAGLDVISDTAKRVDKLDIFTLNHDLLVEAQCAANEIGFEDGFAHRKGELRVFDGWPENRTERVRLFKLHGSVNWFLYDFPDWARQYAIPDEDAFHSHDEDGKLVIPAEWKAAFLSGTIVKEQTYGIGFFGDLFTAFRQHLSSHKHLIACGYGFGDPGINARIYQWLNDALDGSNKLVVLSKGSPPDFFAQKPLWLQELYFQGRLVFVDRWLQDCTVEELTPYFDN